jgi:hypothetical protein
MFIDTIVEGERISCMGDSSPPKMSKKCQKNALPRGFVGLGGSKTHNTTTMKSKRCNYHTKLDSP